MYREPAEDPFPILHDAWPAWILFLQCSTQWIRTEGIATGLYYPSVFGALDLLGYKRRRRLELWQYVQHIERGALAAMNQVSLDRILDG